MSAVLRASGQDFDVDAFVAESDWHIGSVFRRGDPRLRTRPNGRKCDASGLNVVVSGADFDDFAAQVRDAVAFLTERGAELRRLTEFPGVASVVLDFGIASRDVLLQSAHFPAELVRLAGACGIALELSHYTVEDRGSAAI